MAKPWLTEREAVKTLVNPLYVGLGGLPRLVDDETYIAANKKLIEEMGPDVYLANLLGALRESLGNTD